MIRLAWRYLWAEPLTAALNLLLLSLGLAAIGFVLLVGEQIEAGVRRDLAGIDLVVGAKGSPMQIMLAGVFHLDVPTGNIPLATLDALRANRLVERAVPVSLGDTVHGFRIVGTTAAYLALYPTPLASGRVWAQPMEALLGAEAARATGLKPGDRFVGSHGLGEQGEAHEHHDYIVVGVLAASGGVIDRLVLTDLASVWAVHDEAKNDEVTMALVRYRSPLAAISLPRWVNAQPGLQAAAPALETARLLTMVGAGTEVLRGFGLVLLAAAGLSVFVALLHSVRARTPDLAMLRMLGAPPLRVAALVSMEAVSLAALASVISLGLSHALVAVLGRVLAAQQSLRISGAWLSPWELAIPLIALGLAVLAAAWPTWRAFRLDVTALLQAPR